MSPVRNQNMKLVERTKIQKSSDLAISNGVRKILFIVTQSEFGGAQRYIYELIGGLNPEKYNFVIAAGEGNEELFEKISKLKSPGTREVGANLNLKTQNLKYLKRTPLPWQIIFSIREIFNLLKGEKLDILFLCSTTAGLLGSISKLFYQLITKNYKLKTIYRIGGWAFRDPRPSWQNKILLWAEKITAPLKDKIIVNCESDRQLAIKYKICSTEKIIKIYNGIDPEDLDFLPKEEAINYLNSKVKMQNAKLQVKTQNLIGCVANFYKTKGLPYLIEAAHLLNSKFKIQNSKFLIIGDGKQRSLLEALIKKYNLENTVFLLGQIPDAYKYLKAFDIFVLPSLKEGFPWIILEAMAAEIPIIATNVGAIPEIIENGKEGILIEPKNSQILAEKFFWFLNNQGRAKKMGIKAREKVKKFSLQKMLKETEFLLK